MRSLQLLRRLRYWRSPRRLAVEVPARTLVAYIQSELSALCQDANWSFVGRRKWSRRGRRLFRARIEDYEWLLFPYAPSAEDAGASMCILPAPRHRFAEWEGSYYLLSYDSDKLEFMLQHDTRRGGTEPMPLPWLSRYTGISADTCESLPPPSRWLASALARLTRRVSPNHFSFT